MNQPVPPALQAIEQDDDAIDLAEYLDILLDNRGLIAAIALVVMLLGAAYAFLARPIYEANILIQVEDSAGSSKNILGDLSSVFDLKTGASSEMEILRSRMVVSRAVDNSRFYITVEPKYFPLLGAWVARRSKTLSEPGLLGYGGYAWGKESAQLSVFNVPEELEDIEFVLTAGENQDFRLTQAKKEIDITGRVGDTVKATTAYGEVQILVDALLAKPGTQFLLTRSSRLDTIEKMQADLKIAEKGKQSGIIGVSLEGSDAKNTSGILNEIGREYIRQNVDRKAEEAEKSLEFLNKQLPDLKNELERSENRYNQLRNKSGTIDLGEEAKAILQQSVLAQSKMVELRQKREELLVRFQNGHPAVEGINQQIRELSRELDSIDGKIKRLPAVEQDVLRLTRDVKVNTDLYTALLNTAQQLRLVKASKVGNARLLDTAVIPVKPVRPKRAIVIALAALIGVFLGIVAAYVKRNLYGGIDDPHEIEELLGLSVSATVPHSAAQEQLYGQIKDKERKVLVLAQEDPSDFAVESLRSFRTAFQFSMLGAKNNIIVITGPTPGVGKSFVSVNFTAVLAATGKKVLLVDGDMRKGYLNRYFGLERENGLSDAIVAGKTSDHLIHKSVLENVDFISTGALPPRPAELLSHRHFSDLLQDLSARYDYVVVDTAPVLAVSDALIVGPHAGALFAIARGGLSTVGEIAESAKRFSQAGVSVTGVIFNDLKPRTSRYAYGSKYGKYRYAQYKY